MNSQHKGQSFGSIQTSFCFLDTWISVRDLNELPICSRKPTDLDRRPNVQSFDHTTAPISAEIGNCWSLHILYAAREESLSNIATSHRSPSIRFKHFWVVSQHSSGVMIEWILMIWFLHAHLIREHKATTIPWLIEMTFLYREKVIQPINYGVYVQNRFPVFSKNV